MPPIKTILVATSLLFFSVPGVADGFGVDKVYHPYVEAMEQEVEWRVVADNGPEADSTSTQTHRLAYGRALGERWFGEIYLIGEKIGGEPLEVEAYELEILHQLTEQGEYWADFGVLFELEKEKGVDIWEAGTGLLVEKEHGQFSTLANFIVINEWGKDIEDELESTFALQTRYRHSMAFEPAIEFHSGENTRALGPVFLGDIRLGLRRNLHWELGLFAGLDSKTPDTSMRAGIEYEF